MKSEMALTKRFAHLIAAETRSRGYKYYLEKKVSHCTGDRQFVAATVRGSGGDYGVRLSAEEDGIVATCGCSYIQHAVCAHVWAVMLTADVRGLMSDAERAPVRIECFIDFPDVEEDIDEFDDEIESNYGQGGYDERPGRSRPRPTPPRRAAVNERRTNEPVGGWRSQLAELSSALGSSPPAPAKTSQLLYIVDVESSASSPGLAVELALRQIKKNGEWGKPKAQGFDWNRITGLTEDDLTIAALLKGPSVRSDYSSYSYQYNVESYVSPRYSLLHPLRLTLIPMMCRTGRCLLRLSASDQEPSLIEWDDGPPLEIVLDAQINSAATQFAVVPFLSRGGERINLAEAVLIAEGGMVFFRGRAARLNDGGQYAWLSNLIRRGPLRVDIKHAQEALGQLLEMPKLPPLTLPEQLSYDEVRITPSPRLKIKKDAEKSYWRSNPPLIGEVSFDYQGVIVPLSDKKRGVYQSEHRRFVLRDAETEERLIERLMEAGFRSGGPNSSNLLELAPSRLPKAVRQLVAEGWNVEAEGKLYRTPGTAQLSLTSGIDWFDLTGTVEYDGQAASLPELLAALKKGDGVVKLGDGTFGILPEDWLKKYTPLAGLGEVDGEAVRFKRSQAGLLDAMLATQPDVSFDAAFTRAREALKEFERVDPREPAGHFTGTLRAYQKDGLGWLSFLQQFGFG